MISANDIRTSTFSRSGRGYKIQDVDDLLEQAAESMEQLQRENAELIQKLKVLADRIQEYREEEDSIRSALLTAQKSADKIMKEAALEKEQILADTRQQSDDMIRLSQEKAVNIANETREKVATVITEAKEKASTIMAEAKETSDRMLAEAVNGCKVEKQYLEFLREQEKDFRMKLIDMYKSQFEILKKGPEIIKELDASLASQQEPVSVIEAVNEAVTVQEEAEETVEPVVEEQPEFVEPEDIPLPIDDGAAAFHVDQPEEEDAGISNGFEIKRKFTDLKFGDDYDIASDDDYDEV